MPAPTRSALRVLLRREIWYLSLVGMGSGLTWATYLTFWPVFAKDDFGLGESTVGLVLGLSALAIVPASLMASAVLRLGGRRLALVVATLLQIPAFGLLVLTDNLLLLIAIGVAQGLTWFYFPILFTVPFQIPGLNDREIAVGTALFMMSTTGAGCASRRRRYRSSDARGRDSLSAPTAGGDQEAERGRRRACMIDDSPLYQSSVLRDIPSSSHPLTPLPVVLPWYCN